MTLPDRIRARLKELRRKPVPLAELIPLLQESADCIEQQRQELQLRQNVIEEADSVVRSQLELIGKLRGLLGQTRTYVYAEMIQRERLLDTSQLLLPSVPARSVEQEYATLATMLGHIDNLLAQVPDRRKTERDTYAIQAPDEDSEAPGIQNARSGVL